jgi:hypothetical protein
MQEHRYIPKNGHRSMSVYVNQEKNIWISVVKEIMCVTLQTNLLQKLLPYLSSAKKVMSRSAAAVSFPAVSNTSASDRAQNHFNTAVS